MVLYKGFRDRYTRRSAYRQTNAIADYMIITLLTYFNIGEYITCLVEICISLQSKIVIEIT